MHVQMQIAEQVVKVNFLGYRFQQKKSQLASMPRVASLSDDMTFAAITDMPQCQRMGIMAAFTSFGQFTMYFDAVMNKFASPPGSPKLMPQPGNEVSDPQSNVSFPDT